MAEIEVFYATNRNIVRETPQPAFGEDFNVQGPHVVRFGSALVDASGRKDKRKYKLKSIKLAGEFIPTKPAEEKKKQLGSLEILDKLRARMDGDKMDSLCLLHGYASDFETALLRGAELQDKWSEGRRLCVFVFSWPANGSTTPFLDYMSDRRDAQASGVAIARTFLKLRQYLIDIGRQQHCQQAIHLCAHSMGNWALRHALQAIREELDDRLPRLLDHVFLMAADEDNDAFEHDGKLRLLPDLAKAVHVYFSEDDKALVISDVTKRNPDRLGATGPRIRANLPRKLDLVDCRLVDHVPPEELSLDEIGRSLSQHQYYRLRPEVIADVKQVLAGTKPSDIEGRDFVQEDLSYLIQAAPKAKPAKRRRNLVGKTGPKK